MSAQQSAFTIHANETPLEDLPRASRFLTRYKLTRGAKKALWYHLRSIGVTGGVLFPDLPHLADDIEKMHWEYEWVQH